MIDPTVRTPDSPLWLRYGALVAGPLAALIVFWLAGAGRGELTWAGCVTLGIGVWMALWWVFEVVPVEATALLPIVAFPVLGLADIRAACAPYADPVVFFFMGGMMLGAALERFGVPRRFALFVLSCVGDRPSLLVGGVMLATAMISMWVNNTSTAVMMLPLALSLHRFVAARQGEARAAGVRNFGCCLVLGVAFASNIGGLGTLFGSSPNVVLTSQLRALTGSTLSFNQYAMLGLPLVAMLLPASWLVLVTLFPPRLEAMAGLHQEIERERAALGGWNVGERVVLVVFALAVALWVLMEPLNGWLASWTGVRGVLSEAGIAIGAALVLFVCPVDVRGHRFALDWKTAGQIPWGILVLFGGGLSLAAALSAHGVNREIGEMFSAFGGVPPLVLVMIVAVVVVLLTEFASNTAVATTFIPIAISVAPSVGLHPFELAVVVSMAASCGFALPVGTPPNALAYATGLVSMRRFVGAGLIVDALAAAAISGVAFALMRALIDLPVLNASIVTPGAGL